MEKYAVTGMSCAACSARIEKAVSCVPGVTSCSVSLLTNSMGVEGNAAPTDIIRAVADAGYAASLMTSAQSGTACGTDSANGVNSGYEKQEELLQDRETPMLRKRFWISIIFLVFLMYISMGHMMWNWPVPGGLNDNHIAMGLVQLLLTVAIMVINQSFFISGFKSLVRLAPNMDTLIALGSVAAFIYSTYALFAMTDAQIKGEFDTVMSYMHEFYFESAGTILTLITLGKLLEARSKGRTTDAIKALMKLAPRTAVIEMDGQEAEVPISEVKKGDIFIVRAGENIPVDGIVIEGFGSVNESALNGESIPSDKSVGDIVSAATINKAGYMRCEATRVGEDTTLSQIIRMVSDAAATKAPIAKVADKVSGIFVPAVIIIALVTIVVWLLSGQSVGFALARGIAVLVISCPCALGLATPVAIMVGNGVGAGNGIMFKTATSLEETGKTKIIALDKTGTITKGEPSVTDIITANGISDYELLGYAYALEKKSEHPLAYAIVSYVENMSVQLDHQSPGMSVKTFNNVSDFKNMPGNGLSAICDGGSVVGGNEKYIKSVIDVKKDEYKDIFERAGKLADAGKTPLFFAENKKILGVIAVADTIKEEAPQAIRELRNMGIRVVMLTGDNEITAGAIGSQVGVDEIIAGVLPDGKENVIRRLKNNGRVAMVGDGINDAPALTRADTGIAIGAGADIAIDAADVVLMKSSLTDVPAAIRLSRATLRNIRQNLFWAFIYNVIGIPLAAGVWIPLFGLKLNPMFAAAAMSLSSFCVVTNALRLNLCKIYEGSRDKKIKTGKEKRNKMERSIKIEGMMCGHCEANVKKALESLAEVDEAIVSHEDGTAIVKLNARLDDDVLRKTVEDKDYKVLEIN